MSFEFSYHNIEVFFSTVNENDPGSLQSFTVEKNFLLSSAVDTVSSGGDGPAFTTPLTTGQVAIMDVS